MTDYSSMPPEDEPSPRKTPSELTDEGAETMGSQDVPDGMDEDKTDGPSGSEDMDDGIPDGPPSTPKPKKNKSTKRKQRQEKKCKCNLTIDGEKYTITLNLKKSGKKKRKKSTKKDKATDDMPDEMMGGRMNRDRQIRGSTKKKKKSSKKKKKSRGRRTQRSRR